MMEELKTCPFCDSDDLDFIESNCEEFVLISCCDCCSSSCSENSEDKAVKSWNKRVTDNRIEEALKILNDITSISFLVRGKNSYVIKDESIWSVITGVAKIKSILEDKS